MCGIAGFINTKGSDEKRFAIHKMVELLHHRGPDDQGYYADENIALGHARLSIIDLSSAGHQPMLNEDQNTIIVFNGEIYNYLSLKKELQENGRKFNSTSDTEVILNGFLQWGTAIFQKLNGIFAIAIWDKKSQTLFLARDRFGIKPLYCECENEEIIFASEPKSILAVNNGERKINKQALHEFMFYGNPLGVQTLFEGIQQISPGTFCIFKEGKKQEYFYWKPENIVPSKHNEIDAIEHTRILLENAVKSQLVSDVPVGVFLSGGIDSSAITAFASKHYNGTLKTYAAYFDFDKGSNDLKRAKSVAQYFNTNHQELEIKGGNLPDIITDLVRFHDAPFSDAANIPLYLLAKEVKDSNKVILQGDGGDEIFAGYRRYQLLDELQNYKGLILAGKLSSLFPFSHPTKNRVERMSAALGNKDDAMRMALLLTVESQKNSPTRVLGKEYRMLLNGVDPFAEYKKCNARFAHLPLVQRMLYTDTQIILPSTFLEKVDKSTMAQSIEVRVPLLDNDLAEYVMGLPQEFKVKKGQKKWLMRQALRGVVPDDILDAPKTGFGVPYENWLKEPLKDFLNDTLFTHKNKEMKLFDEKVLNKLITEHQTGKANHGFLLWKTMNFSIWLQHNKVQF